MFFLLQLSIAADNITSTRSIKDGETISSAKEIFELGFFSPVDSDNRYLGIWFKKLLPRTFVWVANRNTPVTDFSGVLKFSDNGNLVLVNVTESIIWSSNASKVENPIAELLDTGNLIIREVGSNDPKEFLWQSFDYPTDTLLPGMKLGWDRKSGLSRFLASWKSSDNPSVGEYAYKIDRNGVPQGFLSNPEGPVYRTGSWNGVRSTGVPQLNQAYLFDFQFVFTEDELFYSYSAKNKSLISRLVLSREGKLERNIWLDADQKWNMLWSFPKDDCDKYMVCGDYGICNVSVSSICNCMTGYEPKNSEDWFLRDWSDGCIQETKYDCQKNDGFLKMENMKLPDTSRSFFDREMSLKECEAVCIKNCSCKAYSSLNITRGTGCITWADELKDLRQYTSDGQDLYIRVADSELGSNGNKGKTENKESNSSSKRNKQIILAVTLTVVPAVLLCGLVLGFINKKKQKKGNERSTETRAFKERSHELPLFEMISTRDYSSESKEDVIELPLFNLHTIETATENFSSVNMLGQGGFGSVYKGTLEDGQKVAVKRLSRYSGQGLDEFKTEVLLIARLQHRNLVRLLGCCVEGEEKMLIYEHMQNKSLDSILFNKEKGMSLDWQKRIEIVAGIARGLLYLHQDSRLRIIHRDLKPSNILLDSDMNPKISDFGMARIFGANQTEGNTMRVVGTYGYMSPEYAMDGLFSIKSDVYSFGVLVLEIISGKKNRGYTFSDNQSNLLGYAWTLWKEGRSLELIDPLIGNSCQLNEALRCIQIGLLCVQERAEDRPTMSNIVLMLSSEVLTLPQPKYPGFGRVSSPSETDSSPETEQLYTTNQMSVTIFGAR